MSRGHLFFWLVQNSECPVSKAKYKLTYSTKWGCNYRTLRFASLTGASMRMRRIHSI